MSILTFTNEEEPCQHCCKATAKIVESHLIKKILLEYAFSMCMKGSFANSPKKYVFDQLFFSVTNYGVSASISFSQQAFPVRACTANNLTKQIFFRMNKARRLPHLMLENKFIYECTKKVRTNEASEKKRLSHGQTKKAWLSGP